jgi:ferredoxin
MILCDTSAAAKLYVPERESAAVRRRLEAEDEVCLSELARKFMPKVTLLPGGQSAEVPAGTLLLDAGEEAGVEMEAGCFNCSCGTCAVAIASGMENLDPPTDEELNVLDQWNKDPEKYRLTCCVKIQKGEVVMRMEH